jgi:hypothetical protein
MPVASGGVPQVQQCTVAGHARPTPTAPTRSTALVMLTRPAALVHEGRPGVATADRQGTPRNEPADRENSREVERRSGRASSQSAKLLKFESTWTRRRPTGGQSRIDGGHGRSGGDGEWRQ